MLGAGQLASGIRLDAAKATEALRPFGGAIGHDVEATAIGVMRIAAASMANAMREVSIEQGIDARDATLLPFGGAGPLMACLLADELAMHRIVLPRLAGNFSAWGLLGADMIRSAARTRIMELTPRSLVVVNEILGVLFTSLAADSGEQQVLLDLRYRGQEHWLSVAVPLANSKVVLLADAIKAQFQREYERTFAGNLPGTVEIVTIRASVRVTLPRRAEPRQTSTGRLPSRIESGDAHSFVLGRRERFRWIARDLIQSPLAGPAIVAEPTTTLYLDAGWTASPGDHGELLLVRGNLKP